MTTALFAGTFDPPTLGHLEIIQRASGLCKKLYVAVAKNEEKKHFFLPQKERIALLKALTKEISHIEVVVFEGLVVDFAKKMNVDFLVRGIRNGNDLDFEMQMASANRLMTGVETVCLLSSPQYSQISSTLIREIASYGRSVKEFVPEEVEHLLQSKQNLFNT